jgi:hypothetical protein
MNRRDTIKSLLAGLFCGWWTKKVEARAVEVIPHKSWQGKLAHKTIEHKNSAGESRYSQVYYLTFEDVMSSEDYVTKVLGYPNMPIIGSRYR